MSLEQAPMNQLITDNIDTWTSTVKTKATTGRGSSKKRELYGIKKLRELILELAVRGKLVPQDPTNEPASVLLERNFKEQARLVQTDKLKTKANRSFSVEDDYLTVPVSWDRIRLGNLAKFIDYRGKTPKKIDSGVRLITAKNVKFGHISLLPEEFISEGEYVSWMTRGFPRVGDILFTPEAPLGNVAQVDLEEKFALAQRAICFQLHIPEISDFLKLFLMAPSFQNLLLEKATGTTAKGIKASILKELLVYLPSLNEQHRIVTKVDELMALCDQLEQQTEASLDAHQVLVETLLATLTNSQDANELMANWARISEHFDTLFTTEQSIDQLKQTILQLAVMGKLVPQDPKDEPAAKLLERIAIEKAQLVKEKKIKKQKALPPIAEDEKPFELPKGWEWCRLQSLVILLGDGLHGTPQYDESGEYYFINGNNLRDGEILIKPETKTVGRAEYEKHRKALDENTVLVSINGTLGNVAFYNNEPIMLGKSACYFNLWHELDKRYFKRLIEAPMFMGYAISKATGSTIKNLGLKAMNDMPVALPPLDEQQRIIAKVDELMALCGQLKQRLRDSQQTQLKLTDAIVEQAL